MNTIQLHLVRSLVTTSEPGNSPIPIATHWMNTMAISQPQTIPGVPAYPIPKYKVEAKEGSNPRTANETQKVVHRENSRLNSGLSTRQHLRFLAVVAV